MGSSGLCSLFAWYKAVHSVPDHPLISRRRLSTSSAAAPDHIDRSGRSKSCHRPLTWDGIAQLLQQRIWLGYNWAVRITTTHYFFITLFPVYLVQAPAHSVLKGGFAVRCLRCAGQ